jgi:hypothetical protein
VLFSSHDLKPMPSNDLHESSVLEIEVYRYHKIGRDDYIGGMKENIEVLLAEGATGQSFRSSTACTRKHRTQPPFAAT